MGEGITEAYRHYAADPEVGCELRTTRAGGAWTIAMSIPSVLAGSVGVGMDRDPTGDELDEIDEVLRGSPNDSFIGCPAHVSEETIDAIMARGFAFRRLEAILVRRLDGPLPEPPEVPGLLIRRLTADDPELNAWIARDLAWFEDKEEAEDPAAVGPTTTRPVARTIHAFARHHATELYVAELDGQPAAVTKLFRDPVSIDDDPLGPAVPRPTLGALIGASVAPSMRRRGIQHALLAFRLRRFRDLGFTHARIGGDVLGATDRNARRLGFEPWCTRLQFKRANTAAT